MSLFKWSQTAATNATADGSINWAEGQAPSSVNDSARGMMAAVAKYRDDTAGSITTGGTGSAYTLTTSQGFTTLALMNGAKIAFVAHTSSITPVTLNVDGLGAKPLRRYFGFEIATLDLVISSVYVCTYNNSDGVFYLHTLESAFQAGTLMLFQQTSAPAGWTKQATHNDKALRVVSGAAASGGTSAFSSVFGTTATNSYTLQTADVPSHNHTATDSGHTHTTGFTVTGGGTVGFAAGASGTSAVTGSGTANISVGNSGGGGGHSHAIELRVQYVDLIIAAKA